METTIAGGSTTRQGWRLSILTATTCCIHPEVRSAVTRNKNMKDPEGAPLLFGTSTILTGRYLVQKGKLSWEALCNGWQDFG